jgi:hypothetical protein
VLRAGNEACGVWVRAGSWSSQQLTDGFVPEDIAGTIGKPATLRRLVAAGLWLPADGGFHFHEWQVRNPSRAQVEADREAARKRQERWRRQRRNEDGSFGEGETDD